VKVVRCLPIGKRRSLASSFASNCCWRRSRKKPTRRGISFSQPRRPSRQPQRWAQPEGHWAGVFRCSSVQGALPRFVDRRPANLKQAWLKLPLGENGLAFLGPPCPPQAGCWRSYLDRRPYISWIRLGRGNCSPSHFQASAGRGFPSRVKRMASRTGERALCRPSFKMPGTSRVPPRAKLCCSAVGLEALRSSAIRRPNRGRGLGSGDGLRTQRAGRIIGCSFNRVGIAGHQDADLVRT
jgi:hypothetical protein